MCISGQNTALQIPFDQNNSLKNEFFSASAPGLKFRCFTAPFVSLPTFDYPTKLLYALAFSSCESSPVTTTLSVTLFHHANSLLIPIPHSLILSLPRPVNLIFPDPILQRPLKRKRYLLYLSFLPSLPQPFDFGTLIRVRV